MNADVRKFTAVISTSHQNIVRIMNRERGGRVMEDNIDRQSAIDEIKALRPFAIVLDNSTEMERVE